MYLDANKLYGWTMFQELLQVVLNERRKHIFDEKCIKKYDEDSDKGYINAHGDPPF